MMMSTTRVAIAIRRRRSFVKVAAKICMRVLEYCTLVHTALGSHVHRIRVFVIRVVRWAVSEACEKKLVDYAKPSNGATVGKSLHT